jgi:hypothetical protein
MRVILLAMLVVLGALLPAQAEDFDRIGAFLSLEGHEDLLFLAGDITPQTPLDFRTALALHPEVETLVLVSNGGSVTAGLLLADDVYFRELNTYVPQGAGCYSACAYIFLAGASRQADGDLGVHQFYGGDDSAESAQFVVSDILDMLTKFETPQPVISRMLRTTSDDMYIFSDDEIADLAINRGAKTFKSFTATFDALPSALSDEFVAALAPAEDPVGGDTGTAPAPQSLPRFAIYSGVDFYGADVAKIRVDDVLQCLDACFGNNQCRAITLNTNPAFKTGPNCFLKDGMGETEFYEQAISGVFLLQSESEVLNVDGQRVYPEDVFTPD